MTLSTKTIQAIRREIRAGRYITPEREEVAMNRLLNDIARQQIDDALPGSAAEAMCSTDTEGE